MKEVEEYQKTEQYKKYLQTIVGEQKVISTSQANVAVCQKEALQFKKVPSFLSIQFLNVQLR